MNIRTEQPGEQPRPQHAVIRKGNERPVARPQQPVSPPEADRPSGLKCLVPTRVRSGRLLRRGWPNRASGRAHGPASSQGAVNQNDNGRASQGWSHPQAKPAPPVQERNPAQARDDENKFRNWQQQRQQAARRRIAHRRSNTRSRIRPAAEQDSRPKSQG